MTIRAFTVCKEYAKASFEVVKHPIKETGDHCGRFWKDMSKTEKALTTLKVIIAAVVVGTIGAVIGAAFGLIAPVLTFVAAPLAITGALIGGVSMFMYLTRKKPESDLEKDLNTMLKTTKKGTEAEIKKEVTLQAQINEKVAARLAIIEAQEAEAKKAASEVEKNVVVV